MSQTLRVLAATLVMLIAPTSLRAAEPQPIRLYDGVTQFLHNPEGKAFTFELDVRDLNTFEPYPTELLVKVYDPSGKVVVREVVPDDGVVRRSYLPPLGGWDHEMWYYTECYTRGSLPMLRWSSFSEPATLGGITPRRFKYEIPAGVKGVYRAMVVGTRDHAVTLRTTPELPAAVAGHVFWLHGHGDMYRKSFIHVPRGTIALNLGFVEYDRPQSRRFTLTAPDGKKLFDGPAAGGFTQTDVKLDKPGQYDDQLLTLDVSAGPNDFMLHVLLRNETTGDARNGPTCVAAVLAPDEATAKAAQGGAIYHDGRVYWHMFQVRMHDWLKTLKPEDFVPRDEKGEEIKVVETTSGSAGSQGFRLANFPLRKGFTPLNGPHEKPPLSDAIMSDYPVWKNRQALNLAIRDIHESGLRRIVVGDHVATSGWNGNLGYLMGTYGWHFWRPAWRVLQQSDAPDEVKAILREAFILAGDRIAFARNIERVNGNAFAHIVMALRYCRAATGDPLQVRLADTFFDRFTTGGFGEGIGQSPNGDIHEHFAHDHHYGSYTLYNWINPVADFDDQRFAAALQKLRNLYSYTWCRDAYANPWSSRTHGSLEESILKAQGITWQGDPGPDFTLSINDAKEWFAARRKAYYALTFHGRLAPMWLNNYFATRIGYGGGVLCQLTVPGKGTVLASTLAESYGKDMEPRNWRRFHLHSVVGTMADGLPLVAADSEHFGAKFKGNVVTSDGEVRDCPVRSTRRYTFGQDAIDCEVSLDDTSYRNMLWGMGRKSVVNEAFEMIPFVNKGPEGKPASVRFVAPAADSATQDLTATPADALTVRIDRGGYGVEIRFEKPVKVQRGENDTVLVTLVEKPSPAAGVKLQYKLVPFGG